MQNDCLYVAHSLRRKNISVRWLLHTRATFRWCLLEYQNLDALSELIFVDPGAKINGQYYWDVLLQKLLPAMRRVSGNVTFQQDSAPVHSARDTIELLRRSTQTSLFQTCGHLTHRTSIRLTMPSGQSCSSVCITSESMTLTRCDCVLSPCGVDWNSTLWMTPLISGNVVWEPVSMPKAAILNITQAYKLPVRILYQYFYAFIQTFQCWCEKCCFPISHSSVTHAQWSETFWYPEVRNSLLVNLGVKVFQIS